MKDSISVNLEGRNSLSTKHDDSFIKCIRYFKYSINNRQNKDIGSVQDSVWRNNCIKKKQSSTRVQHICSAALMG